HVLVVEIVVNHQAHLGIEERMVFSQSAQVIIGGVCAMLDLAAPGHARGVDGGAICVNNASQSLNLCFITCGFELLVSQRLSAALTNAARGKNLHHVCAISLKPPDVLANLLNRKLRVVNWTKRGKDARTRDLALGNDITQLFIFGG